MSRLTNNDIIREIEESIADGTSSERQGIGSAFRIRTPYTSRYRNNSAEGSSRSRRERKTNSQEGTL